MKALLIIVLFVGSLQAEQPHWEVVRAHAESSRSAAAQWTFTIRNTSGRMLTVGEDWRFKGKASANFYISLDSFGAGKKLFAEPCHGPQSHLQVEPGATITAVLPDLRGFGRNRLSLAITEGDNIVVIGTLSEISTKGQQGGADQPATAPESKSEGDQKPESDSEGRSQ